ncbi:ArpA protein-Streptomyces griseus [Yersinia enterocolitica]|uniref:ArpA protein-Streptomyces griseus n=1 Tax=Yersinia enterocolitica TaxID=630 RepID=A0A0H5F1E7_YEREN|nr:ArpA protein-Streptomyces griseus [Yersinia enterocolitica]CNC62220.1 ArpA protein-Streptomyces griseus [Yersinia enterocolitica]CNC79053.1 ArpA protein-Streptomyces griseus [Yersinia enterocolitica]CNC83269.1 ArpA protein-Streptomyces griseus [Yersinia enterocolitica]CND04101.1 ArpA protein-Streptomyces griseus [Yersinia enterocolitica]
MTAHPINDPAFIAQSKSTLETYGALVLSNFLLPPALNSIKQEGIEHKHLAYYAANQHNVYLTKTDPEFAADHPRNRLVTSSKGCITDEEIPVDSALRTLYAAIDFQGRQRKHAALNPNGQRQSLAMPVRQQHPQLT